MTDKDAYEAAFQTMVEAQKLFNKPRCINCTNYHGQNTCVQHGEIPDEYLYTPNECPDHSHAPPF